MFVTIEFFSAKAEITKTDLQEELKSEIINLYQISSLSGLQYFDLKGTDEKVEKFAVVTMSNNDRYFISEATHKGLLEVFEELFNTGIKVFHDTGM